MRWCARCATPSRCSVSPHAFMLTGVRGVGKTTTARILARALNCTGPDGENGPTVDPCGVCSNCVAILADRHPDVVEMDAASQYRHRRCARDHRGDALQADDRAHESVHHRRGAYAVAPGLQRAVEDAGRAAAACKIRVSPPPKSARCQ